MWREVHLHSSHAGCERHELTQNQSHGHGCHHQFHQPSEGIRRSDCGVQFDEQRIGDE